MAFIWIVTIYFKFDISDEHFKMLHFKQRLEAHRTYLTLCEFNQRSQFYGVIEEISKYKGGSRQVIMRIKGNFDLEEIDINHSNIISIENGKLKLWLTFDQKNIYLNKGDSIVKNKNSEFIILKYSKIDILHYWRDEFTTCSDAQNINIENELNEYITNYEKARVKKKLNHQTQLYIESIINKKITYPK